MKAVVLAVLAGLGWGIGEVFTRSVLHSGKVGPLTAIAVRSTVALPLIWLAWMVAHKGAFGLKAEPSLADADGATLAKLICGSGVIAGAFAMVCFYGALSVGEVSRVKPIAFTLAPACAVILGWLALGEPLSVRKLVAVALILSGVVLLAR
jgi:uncharacterized membrane protein